MGEDSEGLLDKKHLEQNTEPANSSWVQYSEL